MRQLRFGIFLVIFFGAFCAFSQTKGLIIEPATGSVLDPNGDGMISSSSS
ncbi:MAG: hypothetical protein ACI9A7_002353, partial [Cyclobacteriaceae bacterium]